MWKVGSLYYYTIFSLFKIFINKKEIIIIQLIIPFSSNLILTLISLLSLINLPSKITTDLLVTKFSILICFLPLPSPQHVIPLLKPLLKLFSSLASENHLLILSPILFTLSAFLLFIYVIYLWSIYYCSCWVPQILLILLPLFFSLDNLSYSTNISVYLSDNR